MQVCEHIPVSVMQRNGAWTPAAPQGEISTPRAILAVSGHFNSFGFAKPRLLHVFTHAAVTRVLSADEVARPDGARVWGAPADPMGPTVRRMCGVGGDRSVVRNRFTCDASMEVNAARLNKMGQAQDSAFAARFPMLKGVEAACRWGQALVAPTRCLPLGRVGARALQRLVQNGFGTARGTRSGIPAAELVTGVPSERLTSALAQPQPTRLPPEPFAAPGANARIMGQQIRAGREL